MTATVADAVVATLKASGVRRLAVCAAAAGRETCTW
jgi:hypothetical protein